MGARWRVGVGLATAVLFVVAATLAVLVHRALEPAHAGVWLVTR